MSKRKTEQVGGSKCVSSCTYHALFPGCVACSYKVILLAHFFQPWIFCACRKKSKANLENLSGQLDDENMKPNSVRSKIAAPEGVQRFSDDEEDPNTALINISIEYASQLGPACLHPGPITVCCITHVVVCTRLKKADKRIDGLLKTKNEKTKRRRNVQQMQATAVSDSEEDDGAAEQMAVTARQQANALQAEDGDPEPVVLQQVLFPSNVSFSKLVLQRSLVMVCCLVYKPSRLWVNPGYLPIT